MKNTVSLADKIALFAFFGVAYMVLAFIISCVKSDHVDPVDIVPQAQASMVPCDSIYYEPVAWGQLLRVLPKTVSNGTSRIYGHWWQAKGFAWQIIEPSRYQQDSLRERVVFADTDTIRYTDTFFICRKKHL